MNMKTDFQKLFACVGDILEGNSVSEKIKQSAELNNVLEAIFLCIFGC
jgi:hypothetical protein